MRLIAALVIGVGVLVAATVGAVHFDEYGGVVPKDNKTFTCEKKAAQQVAMAVGKLGACHVKRASGKLADDTAENACEKTVVDAFNAKVSAAPCAPCLSQLTGANLKFIVDGQAGSVYCAGSTTFGGDDDGAKIPPDKKTGTCEKAVAKNAAKLTAAIIGCHVSAAKAALRAKATADTPDTDKSCEDNAKTKFQNKSKTTNCSCVNTADIATAIENLIDLGVERVFCASPSGAFIDGVD